MEELSSSALLVPPHPDPGRVEFVRAVAVPVELETAVFTSVSAPELNDAVNPDPGAVDFFEPGEIAEEAAISSISVEEEIAAEADNLVAVTKTDFALDAEFVDVLPSEQVQSATPIALEWDFDGELQGKDQVIVSLDSVSKIFGEKVALSELSFEVRGNGFYGLLGPNGAGKTTTLSLLSGLLQPDSGQIKLFGEHPGSEACSLRTNVGVLPDRLYTFDKLTGRQLLHYNGVMRGMSGTVLKNRIDELAEAFNLSGDLSRSVSDYSGGMTKKILLAAAVIHSPRLLVLDEPFEGLDPGSVATFLAILRSYVSAGGTVFFSSHGLELVEEICDHVIVIADGRVVAEGSIDAVKQDSSLNERFLKLTGSSADGEILSWLQTFSD